MAIVTFTSDFGFRDHYVAAVKARILHLNQNLKVIDITHEIERFNIAHAAYVLRSVFRDFPMGTVHLVCVNEPMGEEDRLVAVKLEEHYFVGVDNGIFSLLSDKQPTAIVTLNKDQQFSYAFPEKGSMAAAATSLASGIPIYNLGMQTSELRVMLNRQLRVTSNRINGHVIHIDGYGNLITNISREVFMQAHEGRPFELIFSREVITQLSNSYHAVDGGEAVALFNSNGYLEIAISRGNAAQLLGMDFDSPVSIVFE